MDVLYDFFLAHPSACAEQAEALARALEDLGRVVFLDARYRNLDRFVDRIPAAQRASLTTVVLVGAHERTQHRYFESECRRAMRLADAQVLVVAAPPR